MLNIIRFFRGVVITASAAMLVVSGHYWNVEKVLPKILPWFDFFILLILLCVFVMIMQDASEKKKNLCAVLFLCAGFLSLAFVFC